MVRISRVVQDVYGKSGDQPTAYIDETYSVDPHHGLQFYVMAAVIVHASDRDAIRTAICRIADTDYWHTTDQIRSAHGFGVTLELLKYLGDPGGREVCVISHQERIAANDNDGEQARARCFTALMTHLASHDCPAGPVRLLVLERRRERRQANRDADTRKQAIDAELLPADVRLLQVSPSDERLLWLPDLTCSAYRQQLVRHDARLFRAIAGITTIIDPE